MPIPSGNQCLYGGYRLSFGLDLDNDGTLSATEAQQSTLLCSPPLNAGWQGAPSPWNSSMTTSDSSIWPSAPMARPSPPGRGCSAEATSKASTTAPAWAGMLTKAAVSDNNNNLSDAIIMDANVQAVSNGNSWVIWAEELDPTSRRLWTNEWVNP